MLKFLDKYQINEAKIAVGVSGGADSLALVLRMNEELSAIGKKVIALTVDHQLREESKAEAEYVASVMNDFNVEHHILVWEGDKPRTGIEEAAREARYALLQDWCRDNGVNVLAIAHHAKDQAETFFLRLQRGSGLFGLSGMQAVSQRGDLKVIRPLLHTDPKQLKDYLQSKNVEWVEDPSNQCEDFFRVKIRKHLDTWLNELSMPLSRLPETMDELSRARNYIQVQVNKFIKNNVCYWGDCGLSLSFNVLKEQHDEIVFQVLAELLRQVGKQVYIARAEGIERLAKSLFNNFNCINDIGGVKNFSGATLGGCEVFLQYGKIWIVPELKIKNKMPKQVWSDFCELYPVFKKQKLPYKLRVVLVKTKMKVEF